MMNEWLLKQLHEGKLDFGKLERVIWLALMELFRQMMVELLEVLDKNLVAMRDIKRYKLKECNERTIQTMVGTVRFKRRYFWDSEQKRYVYLLDEALGLEKYDQEVQVF